MRVVLVGGGGHGSDVLGAFEAAAAATGQPSPVIGFVDDSATVDLRRFSSRDTPHLGPIEALDAVGATHYVLSVGWPRTRALLAKRLDDYDLRPTSVVHPSAVLGRNVVAADGSAILARACISANVRLGRHTCVSAGSIVGHDSQIGDFAGLMPGAVISGDTILEEGCTIGTNATVIEGIKVGEYSFVGAGAVVLRDVPPGVTVVGNPARPVRTSS